MSGEGWAADLLRRADAAGTEPISAPEGFRGHLRTYQADALGWLAFLDTVGLGGCLALDMGLGKTPTVLAHLARNVGNGPTLVIAPPAVVGNWAAEAARFTPSLQVVVHHGAIRSSAADLRAETGIPGETGGRAGCCGRTTPGAFAMGNGCARFGIPGQNALR